MLRKWILGSAMLALASIPAAAQQYPSGPITLVVPFAAGGATDNAARYIAEQLTRHFDQPVVVENRPGANGLIGTREFIRRAPDGYSILLTTNTTHAANPNLYEEPGYDVLTDFTPVGCLVEVPLVFVSRSSLPVANMAELVDYAKQNPGELTYAWANSTSHAGGELLSYLAEIDIVGIPYSGIPQAMTDLLGGDVDMLLSDPVSALPHIRSGALTALAASSEERIPILADVPVMKEAGIDDYVLVGWMAVFLPAGADSQLVETLNEALAVAVGSPDFTDFAAQSASVAYTCSPGELGDYVASETAKWQTLVEIAGIEKQ